MNCIFVHIYPLRLYNLLDCANRLEYFEYVLRHPDLCSQLQLKCLISRRHIGQYEVARGLSLGVSLIAQALHTQAAVSVHDELEHIEHANISLDVTVS